MKHNLYKYKLYNLIADGLVNIFGYTHPPKIYSVEMHPEIGMVFIKTDRGCMNFTRASRMYNISKIYNILSPFGVNINNIENFKNKLNR